MAAKKKKGSVLIREVTRAALERTQSIDTQKLTMLMGGTEEIFYDDVEEKLNNPYINRGETPLAMDIFWPKGSEQKELPVMVTIHGGGLMMGDRRISRPFGRLLAHKGYLVFSLEYRLAPRANVAEALDDVCAGLDEVGRQLVNYNVDFTRMFMAAESAGAYLAFYVSAMHESELLQQAIGYKASRVQFKAIGLNCGMFYTDSDSMGKVMSEQLYGIKALDDDFLRFMNPENPEIISNLPPVFLSTSRGDFINNSTFKVYDALKKEGKEVRLAYCGDETLVHAFFTSQTSHPKTMETVDKMLNWFEDQAKAQRENPEKDAEHEKALTLKTRIKDGSINEQQAWQHVKECNSVNKARLKRVAIINPAEQFTYEQMFEQWDSYAKAFSGLGITSKKKSRAAIIGAISAEVLFAFYGLNMTGTPVSMYSFTDLMPGGLWKGMIKKEKITDLIITDMVVTPDVWNMIQSEREELGLRNVILLHTKLGGPTVGPAELLFNEFNYHALRRLPGTVFMNDLIDRYKDEPIVYGKYSAKSVALIMHSSGTTKGTRKPVPFTNQTVNRVSTKLIGMFAYAPMFKEKRQEIRVLPGFDFSSVLSMMAQGTGYLAAGNTLVLTFFGCMHPKFIRAVDYYKVDTLIITGFIMDQWLARKDIDDISFKSLKMFGLGGSYIPPEKYKQYIPFAREHGFKYPFCRGYGMSECGSNNFHVFDDERLDVIGYANQAPDARLLSDEDNQFHKLTDGAMEGILYLTSEDMSCDTLDGEKLLEYTKIDGVNFICTNDRMKIHEDGSISYGGRADRYFVNNEGIKFEAGVVEVIVSKQPEIAQCAVVPLFDKRLHDTVPALYVIPKDKCNPVESVRKALVKAFITDGGLKDTGLPSQFIIVDNIPVNANGKISIYKLTRDRLQGKAYNINPVKNKDKVTDIEVAEAEQLDSIHGGTLPEGTSGDEAFDIFYALNAPKPESLKNAAKRVKKDLKKKAAAKVEEVLPKVGPKATVIGTKVMGLQMKKKNYDVDFETD